MFIIIYLLILIFAKINYCNHNAIYYDILNCVLEWVLEIGFDIVFYKYFVVSVLFGKMMNYCEFFCVFCLEIKLLHFYIFLKITIMFHDGHYYYYVLFMTELCWQYQLIANVDYSSLGIYFTLLEFNFIFDA